MGKKLSSFHCKNSCWEKTHCKNSHREKLSFFHTKRMLHEMKKTRKHQVTFLTGLWTCFCKSRTNVTQVTVNNVSVWHSVCQLLVQWLRMSYAPSCWSWWTRLLSWNSTSIIWYCWQPSISWLRFHCVCSVPSPDALSIRLWTII